MDNFDISNLNFNESIPLNNDLDKPIPFDDGASETSVSHSPLSLGGNETKEIPRIEVSRPIVKKPAQQIVSTDRITGVKTFFARLHPGAMEFLDDQITVWLKENPGVVVKRTNITTGEVQAKKTEPNIIITVWY